MAQARRRLRFRLLLMVEIPTKHLKLIVRVTFVLRDRKNLGCKTLVIGEHRGLRICPFDILLFALSPALELVLDGLFQNHADLDPIPHFLQLCHLLLLLCSQVLLPYFGVFDPSHKILRSLQKGVNYFAFKL